MGERWRVYACTDSIVGSPSFSFEVHKLEEGGFEARCVSNLELPSAKGETEIEAIRNAQLIVQDWVTSGCKRN